MDTENLDVQQLLTNRDSAITFQYTGASDSCIPFRWNRVFARGASGLAIRVGSRTRPANCLT